MAVKNKTEFTARIASDFANLPARNINAPKVRTFLTDLFDSLAFLTDIPDTFTLTVGTADASGGSDGDVHLQYSGSNLVSIWHRASGSWTEYSVPSGGSGVTVTASTSDASGGSDGDLHLQYTGSTLSSVWFRSSGAWTEYSVPTGGGTSVSKATNAEVDAVDSTDTELSTDLTAGNDEEDNNFLTIRKALRLLQRVLKKASTTLRGTVLLARNVDVDDTETDTTRVPTVAAAKRLVQRLLPDTSVFARLAGATFTGAAKGIAPVANEDFATKQYVDENAHDSSHPDQSGSSTDNRRISALEEVTQELSLEDHESWEDETDVTLYAVFALASGTGYTTDALAGYSWALSFGASADQDYVPLLRVATGRDPNQIRIRRTGSTTTIIRGGWRFAGLEEGGFSYYVHPALSLILGDTLTVQRGTVDAHTRYDGEVTKLDAHEASTYAHQDNPVRVANLPVGAPIGRQVYLTQAHTHPTSEHIFSVPLEFFGTLNTGINGASVADFSSVDGPTAATNQASYPAIMDTARVSGIWQPTLNFGGSFQRLRPIYLAVRGSIGTPTHLHISGFDDLRLALTAAAPPTITVGGTVNRIMQTTEGVYQVLSTAVDNSQPLQFSLEYPGGYLDDDGTIDTGVDHAVGHYEAIAGGQWRTRPNQIIADLVATLASASDADKFALSTALWAEEELYVDASAGTRTDTGWNEVTLSRELTAADDRKILRFHLQNNEVEAFAEIEARRYRLLPHQDSSAGIEARVITLIVGTGDIDEPHHTGQRALNIGRKQENPSSTRTLLIGSDAFGNGANNSWRSHTLRISLTSSGI